MSLRELTGTERFPKSGNTGMIKYWQGFVEDKILTKLG